jgi:hypothetical protein
MDGLTQHYRRSRVTRRAELASQAEDRGSIPLTRSDVSLKARLDERSGSELDVVGTVLAISRIPYGRPRALTPDAVLDEWRGTCSTKHVLLADIAREEWPATAPQLWHRPYLVTRELADGRWGSAVADTVPAAGLVDVHTYATLELDGGRVKVDVTFPLAGWDGRSDIALACGDGEDHPAGADPIATKADLVSRHCDPAVREPFIAALAATEVAG